MYKKISGDCIPLTQKERCPKRYPNLFFLGTLLSRSLTVTKENECRDLLLIKDKDGYKVKKEQHQKVHTILTPKTTPKLNSLAIHFN